MDWAKRNWIKVGIGILILCALFFIKEWNDNLSNKLTQISDKNKKIAEECKYIFDNSLEDTKSRVDNNQTAIKIVKNECLQVLTSLIADFDGDGHSEIGMITSGIGCGSCHGQEVRIIKGDEVVFYKEGSDFRIEPVKDHVGFTLEYPVEDLSTPEAGYIVESYNVRKDGGGLETFHLFSKENKSYEWRD